MIARALRCIGSLAAATMLLQAVDAAALGWLPPQPPLPSFADVKSGYGTSEALLLDRRGVPLSELRIDPRVRQLD